MKSFLGPISRPEVVIAGLYLGGDLVVVGRTVPLSPTQSAALGANHPINPGGYQPTVRSRSAGAGG
jgi:hypothetical protein